MQTLNRKWCYHGVNTRMGHSESCRARSRGPWLRLGRVKEALPGPGDVRKPEGSIGVSQRKGSTCEGVRVRVGSIWCICCRERGGRGGKEARPVRETDEVARRRWLAWAGMWWKGMNYREDEYTELRDWVPEVPGSVHRGKGVKEDPLVTGLGSWVGRCSFHSLK